MNFFIAKTKFKIKLLFTDPKKLAGILWSMAKRPFIDLSAMEHGRGTSDAESAALKKYASSATLGIVEIGVLDGLTTKEMAMAASVPIYGIDPIIPDSMGKSLVGSEEEIRKNMAFYRDFIFYKDFSFNVVKSWKHGFDFIFIDGDHTYDAVKRDFEDWFPLLASGGVLAFHDSAPMTSNPDGFFLGWPGPTRLVKEIKQLSTISYLETVDSLTLFKKL